MLAVQTLDLLRLSFLCAAITEAPGQRLFARHLEWVHECKDAVQALRLTIKQAKAHREQCCSVLGAALAAALALEQAVHSCANNAAKAQELQRLYAAVVAAVELAQQRVQVSPACCRRPGACTHVLRLAHALLFLKAMYHASNASSGRCWQTSCCDANKVMHQSHQL